MYLLKSTEANVLGGAGVAFGWANNVTGKPKSVTIMITSSAAVVATLQINTGLSGAGTTYSFDLNEGAALTADAGYSFSCALPDQYSINVYMSGACTVTGYMFMVED